MFTHTAVLFLLDDGMSPLPMMAVSRHSFGKGGPTPSRDGTATVLVHVPRETAGVGLG